MIEDRINLYVPEIIIQSFWFWCCFQTEYCQQTRVTHLSSETSVVPLHPAKSFGRVSVCLSLLWSCRYSGKSLWGKRCVIFKWICSPVLATVAAEMWEAAMTGEIFIQRVFWSVHQSFIYSWLLLQYKAHTVQHHHFPAMLDGISILRWSVGPVFHVPAVIGYVTEMHHWDPMTCWQGAPKCVHVKPKPPTLANTHWGRTESQAGKL